MKKLQTYLLFVFIFVLAFRVNGQVERSLNVSPSTEIYSEINTITPPGDQKILSAMEEISYCEASGNSDENLFSISSVIIGTISNTETGSDGYSDYTYLSTQLYPGQKNVSISILTQNYWWQTERAAWIDWNMDGDFLDAGENIVCEGQGAWFDVPENAITGNTRLRVRSVFEEFPSYNICDYPCGESSYGEVEDYTINLSSM